MNIDELKLRQNDLLAVNILSHEGDIYLVEAEFSHEKSLLTQEGRPKRYHSVYEVKEALEGLQVPAYQLVFDSPYDEI